MSFLCVLAEMYMYPYMFMAELIIFSQHECLCFETCFETCFTSVCKRECLSERVGESIRKGQRERKNERRKKE